MTDIRTVSESSAVLGVSMPKGSDLVNVVFLRRVCRMAITNNIQNVLLFLLRIYRSFCGIPTPVPGVTVGGGVWCNVHVSFHHVISTVS